MRLKDVEYTHVCAYWVQNMNTDAMEAKNNETIYNSQELIDNLKSPEEKVDPMVADLLNELIDRSASENSMSICSNQVFDKQTMSNYLTSEKINAQTIFQESKIVKSFDESEISTIPCLSVSDNLISDKRAPEESTSAGSMLEMLDHTNTCNDSVKVHFYNSVQDNKTASVDLNAENMDVQTIFQEPQIIIACAETEVSTTLSHGVNEKISERVVLEECVTVDLVTDHTTEDSSQVFSGFHGDCQTESTNLFSGKVDDQIIFKELPIEESFDEIQKTSPCQIISEDFFNDKVTSSEISDSIVEKMDQTEDTVSVRSTSNQETDNQILLTTFNSEKMDDQVAFQESPIVASRNNLKQPNSPIQEGDNLKSEKIDAVEPVVDDGLSKLNQTILDNSTEVGFVSNNENIQLIDTTDQKIINQKFSIESTTEEPCVEENEETIHEIKEKNIDRQTSDDVIILSDDESNFNKNQLFTNSIVDDNLKKLECPFEWIQNTELAEKFDESQELKIDIDEEPVLSLMISIMIAYFRTIKKNYTGAKKKLDEIERTWEMLDKEEIQKDNISVKVLQHIMLATKYYVYKHEGNQIEIAESIKNIDDATNFKNDDDSSTIDGCVAIAWSTFHEAECIEAKLYAKSAIEKNPNCALWYYILTKNMRRERRRRDYLSRPSLEEKKYIIKCTELSNKDFFNIFYAQILKDAKNYDASNKIHMEIFKSNPVSVNTRLRLALVFIRNKNFTEAKSCLDYAEKHRPENSMFLHYKGIYFEKVENNMEKAMEYYKKSAELKNFPADMCYIKCLIHQKRELDCIEYFHHMLRKFENDIIHKQYVYLHLAMISFQKTDFVQALTYFSEAIELDQNNKQLQSFHNEFGDSKYYNIFHFIEDHLMPKLKQLLSDININILKVEHLCKESLQFSKSFKRSLNQDSGDGKRKCYSLQDVAENFSYSPCNQPSEQSQQLSSTKNSTPLSFSNEENRLSSFENKNSTLSNNQGSWAPLNHRQPRDPSDDRKFSQWSNRNSQNRPSRSRHRRRSRNNNFSSHNNEVDCKSSERYQPYSRGRRNNTSGRDQTNRGTFGCLNSRSSPLKNETYLSHNNNVGWVPISCHTENEEADWDDNDSQQALPPKIKNVSSQNNKAGWAPSNFHSNNEDSWESNQSQRPPIEKNDASSLSNKSSWGSKNPRSNNDSNWERDRSRRLPVKNENDSLHNNKGGWAPFNCQSSNTSWESDCSQQSPSKSKKFSSSNVQTGWAPLNRRQRSPKNENFPSFDKEADWDSGNSKQRLSQSANGNFSSSSNRTGGWAPMNRNQQQFSFGKRNFKSFDAEDNWAPPSSFSQDDQNSAPVVNPFHGSQDPRRSNNRRDNQKHY